MVDETTTTKDKDESTLDENGVNASKIKVEALE
jgi:hypothetical protein